MKSAPFDYHAPTTVDEVIALLVELGDGAKVLAGGQSLVPILALRLTAFDHLVDLGRVSSLRGIERRGDMLWIGAGTTQAEIETSSIVADTVPLLSLATPLIGHLQIRNRGTIGGSIAHADPASEYAAVAVALDATVETQSPKGMRAISANEFFKGTWTTALGDDEIVTGIRFPKWDGRCGFAVEEFARRHGDFALAGAVIAMQLDEQLTIQRCNIGLLGLGATPLRAAAAEGSVAGVTVSDVEVAALATLATVNLTSVPSDVHGSSSYRVRVGAEMVARAWTRAVAGALAGSTNGGRV